MIDNNDMINEQELMTAEDREEFLHEEARDFMDQFNKEPMSLDEMIAEHYADPFMNQNQLEHAEYIMHLFYKL